MLALLTEWKFNIRDSCGGEHRLTGFNQYAHKSLP